LTLTKIYCLAHPYQTLVRELVTPSLPTFMISCLNLISPKATVKKGDVPLSLLSVVFGAFATLLPRYPTLYRPEASRIRLATRPYIAPTLSDGFVPSALQESARRLLVLLHLTTVKNAGGDEWGKATRDLIQQIHRTADNVFRAVIEDWESTAGYVGQAADANQELAGGSNTADDLPPWTGIYAGVDRVIGLLAMLEEYIRAETFTSVSLPIGDIMDMTTRMLSVNIPSSSDPTGGLRPHPAVDRDERDGMWSGIPQIHIASLQLIEAVADRLQEGFIPLAAGAIDQLTWCFSSSKSDQTFQSKAYCLVRKLLLLIGKSLDRRQASKLLPVIRSCCGDLTPHDPYSTDSGPPSGTIPKGRHAQIFNGHTPLKTQIMFLDDLHTQNTVAASQLLPLFVSHLPQNHLDVPIRSLIERTAILTRNREAILACIMTPFIGKDSRVISSIMPYATRRYIDDAMVELLLRPRMPVLPGVLDNTSVKEAAVIGLEDEGFVMHLDAPAEPCVNDGDVDIKGLTGLDGEEVDQRPGRPGFGHSPSRRSPSRHSGFSFSASAHVPLNIPQSSAQPPSNARQTDMMLVDPSLALPLAAKRMEHDDVKMGEEPLESSDESVHLNMELDTDSDDQGSLDR
jgi:pre-rRNA-processing protein RIX1